MKAKSCPLETNNRRNSAAIRVPTLLLQRMNLPIFLVTLTVLTTGHSYTFTGCYMANEANGVLKHRALASSQMTHELCRDKCFSRSSDHFGLQGGDNCYCGNQLHDGVNTGEASCRWRCSGNRAQQCGSDMSIRVFTFNDKVPSVMEDAGILHDSQQTEERLLFAISAHCGKGALEEFEKPSSIAFPLNGQIPDVFRSSLLSDLASSIRKLGAKRISAEMHKNGVVVALAEFDVSYDIHEIDLKSWFTPKRLVRTYPFWTGNSISSFVDFGVNGPDDQYNKRRFYIHKTHQLCALDAGLMGIGDTGADFCSWVSKGGKRPVLYYAKSNGAYDSTVGYADKFLVYLK